VIVFDASVALKWYFDEPGGDSAKAELVRYGGEIAVPGVFLVEVTAALVRRANMDKLQRKAMNDALHHFLTLITERFIVVGETDFDEMARAAGIALDLGHPLKDCLYLAHTMKMGCDLLTSDRKFAAKAQSIWPRIRILEG